MFKRFLSIALASAVLSGVPVSAQQPLQWRYSFEDGIATATYSGMVKVGQNGRSVELSVMSFGAICQGSLSVSDSAAIQSALDYAAKIAPATVTLPGNGLCSIATPLSIAEGVTLRGQGSSPKSGLTIISPNMSAAISLDGNSASLRDMFIDGNGISSSGFAIGVTGRNYYNIDNIRLIRTCGTADISGSYGRMTNIYSGDMVGGLACIGIRVGQLTTAANSVDPIFDGITLTARPEEAFGTCMLVKDAGGMFLSRSDMQYCNVGTLLSPDQNQRVSWATISETYLGDTNAVTGFAITTSHATGVVEGLTCNNCWSSVSKGDDNIQVTAGAGGIIDGLHFNGLRAYYANRHAVNISAGLNVTFSNLRACGYKNAGAFLASGISGVQVGNSTLRPSCDNILTQGGLVGLSLAGSNTDLILTSNDIRSNPTPISGLAGANSVVANNIQ